MMSVKRIIQGAYTSYQLLHTRRYMSDVENNTVLGPSDPTLL